MVLGPPGSGGEVVVQALGTVGFTDVSAAARAEHDEWLAARRASRLAPPPFDPTVQRPLTHVPGLSDTASTVSFDPVTALALGDAASRSAAPDLAVIVWTPLEWTVHELARAGVGVALATVLWDRYQRAALVAPDGLPVVVVDGAELRADGPRGAGQLGALWSALGLEAAPEVVATGALAPPRIPVGLDVPSALGVPATGSSREWHPGSLEPMPAWVDELLDATWRAHRSMLEAGEAWQALAAARITRFGDAGGQDLEQWRLRDRAIGLEAELVTARRERDLADARAQDSMRHVEELQREWEGVDLVGLEAARVERDRMVDSLQWRVGHYVLAPVRRARRALRPR